MVKVRKTKNITENSTDIALMVESSTLEEVLEYDENKIYDALILELNCTKKIAKEVATSVTEKIKNLKLETITTSLIRSFVNVELYERKFNKKLKSDSNITISFYDIKQLIENSNKENGNTSHSPESINLSIAERILKEYALRDIFTKEISQAHLEGKIHIHDSGMPNRYYCSGHSVEYIKKYGIKNIPTIPTTSNPANSAWVLARHICSMTQYFSGIFAGAIGWEGLNIFFAPMLINWEYKKVKQLAQTLIFDLAQLAGARGGQLSFTDFNVYINIPEHYKNVYAMGKSGKYMVLDNLGDIHYLNTQEETKEFAKNNNYTVLTYKDFDKESKLFLKAILETIKEGDAVGLPFAFPKINLHINEETFETEQSKALLLLASEASSEKGCPYFIFDRDAFSVSQCCRLSIQFTEEDKKQIKTPEELRFVGIQNVSINLPNIPLQVGNNEEDFYKEVEYRMNLAAQAHIIRRDYVWNLASLSETPLRFYIKGMDGKEYIRLNRGSYLIGIVGLNECIYNFMKQELHESEKAFEKGIEVITFMNLKCKELSKKYGINMKLEETPAESTAGRFAKLDIKKYGDKAFYKENEFGIYYTNSVHFSSDSDVDYITRLMEQSKFHQLVEAGSMIHIWSGDKKPSPQAIYKLIELTWYKTKCVQWVLSPEWTTCYSCKQTFNGFYDKCPSCKNNNIVCTTRITGYYVAIPKFNPAKLAELKDRKRELISERSENND